jgi:hypothetical protein
MEGALRLHHVCVYPAGLLTSAEVVAVTDGFVVLPLAWQKPCRRGFGGGRVIAAGDKVARFGGFAARVLDGVAGGGHDGRAWYGAACGRQVRLRCRLGAFNTRLTDRDPHWIVWCYIEGHDVGPSENLGVWRERATPCPFLTSSTILQMVIEHSNCVSICRCNNLAADSDLRVRFEPLL